MSSCQESGNAQPRVASRDLHYEGVFLRLETLRWIDRDGTQRRWETADRVGGRGAVLLIARLAPSGTLVLIRQFRPPAGRMVVEFPAGLLDGDEAPEACALRELREETGYAGTVESVTPPAYNSPGMTGETVHVVRVRVDESLPENRRPRPATEPGEHIETLLLPPGGEARLLREEAAAGRALDSKVAAYLLARLEHA